MAGSKTTDCTDVEVAPAPEHRYQRAFVPGPSRISQQWRRLSRKTKKTRISSERAITRKGNKEDWNTHSISHTMVC